MGFVMGLIVGFVIGVMPVTRGFVYAQWNRARDYGKRQGWWS